MNIFKTELFNARIRRSLGVSTITLSLLITASACNSEGPLEKAGKSVDKTIDDASDTLDDAGNKADKALDRAEHNIDHGVKK